MAFLKRECRMLAAIVLLATAIAAPAQADDGIRLQEQEIKAGLLYNFLKYVEWPSADAHASPATVVVCLFGADPFDGYLQPMAGRTVNERAIVVRNIRNVQEAADCQLLFVSAGEKDHWPQLHKFLAGKGVLTVGDFDDFDDSGGMIEFGRKDDHISVALNIDSVEAAQLHVKDRLLKLVTVVHRQRP